VAYGSHAHQLLTNSPSARTRAARRALLTAALGFAQFDWHGPVPAPRALPHRLARLWLGVGGVLVGMSAQGFNVEMRQFPDGWRATF
jgi:hypothetical protein